MIFIKYFRMDIIIVMLYVCAVATISCHGVDLNCTFKIYSIDGYNCRVTDLKVDDQFTAITDIKGDHIPRHGNSNVNVLYITSGCMKYFPSSISTYFTNLKKIEVVGSALKYIKQTSFAGLNLLRRIDITNTLLSTIEEDAFNRDHKQLDTLILSYNKIHFFQEETFDELVNLEKLWLSENQLETLPTNLFAKNLKLKHIKLDGNRLRIIDAKFLNSLQHLEIISFERNFCTTKDFPRDLSLDELKDELSNKCTRETELVSLSRLMVLNHTMSILQQNLTQSMAELATEKLNAQSIQANLLAVLEKNIDLEFKLDEALKKIKILNDAESNYIQRNESSTAISNDPGQITIPITTAYSACIFVFFLTVIIVFAAFYIIKANRRSRVSRMMETEMKLQRIALRN